MKYVVIIGDGMADYPLKELNWKTPLQVADHPYMDKITSKGICGTVKTIPSGMDIGTDVAMLSIFGYDPKKHYTGRGPLEAASIGVKLCKTDLAFRCNLITVENKTLVDHSAGHINTDEAKELISCMQKTFAKKQEIDFFTGTSFRHLLVLRGSKYSDKIKCNPPHDVLGQLISKILVKPQNKKSGRTAETLNDMILKSKEILSTHPINLKRKDARKHPGNMIWPWGPGRKLQIPTFREKYKIRGAVISAVDLVKGIGLSAGMDVIRVPGATGYYDTNYEEKADYALKSLGKYDLVVVHVEAPDEASHIGDYNLKIKTIEDLDQRLIGRILEYLENHQTDSYTISVLPDHFTPISKRTHTREPVPFALYSTAFKEGDKVKHFDENSMTKGSLKINKGYQFMPLFLSQVNRITKFGTKNI
ncbi:MAG: cofactor-independent phosphoglycerate mutase [Candidatus Bathyarchaeota archaeon]